MAMTRRNQQGRRDLKRAQAELEKRINSPEGEYTPPPRDECQPHRWHDLIDDTGTVRVVIFTWRHDGRLVDFVMLVEVTDWNAWAQISRIDCCHGFCHVHPPDREEVQTPLHRLNTVDDVEAAFAQASHTIETIARTIRGRRGDDHD